MLEGKFAISINKNWSMPATQLPAFSKVAHETSVQI